MKRENTLARKSIIRKVFSFDQSALLLAVIAIIIFFSIGSEYFFTVKNMMNVLRQSSITLIAGIGMTILLLVGEVDLSIGSLTAVVSVCSMLVLNATHSILIAVLLSLLIGLAVGIVNALIVTRLNVNSLITTLGMLSLLRGIGHLITDAVAVQVKVDTFQLIGNGDVFGIPIPILVAIGLFVLFYFIMSMTTFGRYVYACGDNAEAAKSSGLNVKKVKTICFVLCSILAAFSAVILTARMNSGQPNAGTGFELTVIAAVILGGTSLSGGKGSLFGSLVGIILLQLISNGMILLNISSFYQDVVSGGVIILAVALDTAREKRKEIENENLVKFSEKEENADLR